MTLAEAELVAAMTANTAVGKLVIVAFELGCLKLDALEDYRQEIAAVRRQAEALFDGKGLGGALGMADFEQWETGCLRMIEGMEHYLRTGEVPAQYRTGDWPAEGGTA